MKPWRALILAVGLLAAVSLIGCQTQVPVGASAASVTTTDGGTADAYTMLGCTASEIAKSTPVPASRQKITSICQITHDGLVQLEQSTRSNDDKRTLAMAMQNTAMTQILTIMSADWNGAK